MKATFVTFWVTVRESYWFMPLLMAVAAIGLSFATTALDSRIGSDWLEEITWLHANRPAGARAVLSTVAGSMITVAGVTFSMTILSISHTTGLVGPRLLNNFMRDKGNQFTLGVFISTFLYCLMVLRTVRNAETPPPNASGPLELLSAFVPHVAILVGLLLALVSVGTLIYFIHHVPESIHVSNIVARVGHDLIAQIDRQFPSQIGQPDEQASSRSSDAKLPENFSSASTNISANTTGYVDYVDADGLLELAKANDLILRLRYRAGDFVTPSRVLLQASPGQEVSVELAEQMRSMFICGNQRTATQNLRFVVNQLVEVAMRALSPGVNDPFTAINCMDWLQAGLETLAGRELPAANRFDDENNLRVIAEPEDFTAFSSLVFDQLTPYVSADRNAAVHMMSMIAEVCIQTSDDDRRRELLKSAELLRKACDRHLQSEEGKKTVEDRYRRLIRIHRDPEYRRRVSCEENWIGGRA